eukprot:12898953-Prorocentrum_lima.AAC.1
MAVATFWFRRMNLSGTPSTTRSTVIPYQSTSKAALGSADAEAICRLVRLIHDLYRGTDGKSVMITISESFK